jgi:hypothetical protein
MLLCGSSGRSLSHAPDESDQFFGHREVALPGPFHAGVSLMIRTSAADTNRVASHPASAASLDDSSAWTNRKASQQATRAAHARHLSGRRRFVDPTTCERDYSQAEMEFMQAMHEYKMHKYKQTSGRMFPTWSEVLEVLTALGYERPTRPI